MRSEVCIFDLESAATATIWRTDRLVEAPNWSRDGRFLVINGDGLLWRLDLAGGTDPVRIDTGFATRCNNDHGISPDGATLVISDSSETGRSCIYTLPVEGGVPVRITANVPSYWHAWSPDGATLAFTGMRDGNFDIFAVPAQGGAEVRLTDGGFLHDGPDYTPDGKWLWCNADRGGTMDLWRMRPDGTGLQQMTRDERVNWFPHPSPDGAHVVYLAYEQGVEGHPRDHDVELRLMDADGGNIRTLVSLFGGQGTINVPSWSPDGRRFAFIRYQPQG
ncbi:MAG: hypothetical protein VYD64_11270 [Pseudomonadota bacterium]|nr:hypothetical protein [Pseudomonadota bacterium]